MTHAIATVSAGSFGPKLRPGLDLCIIACGRDVPGPRCVGVRWGAREDLGFPPSGFTVYREVAGKATALGTFFLPDTANWAAFAADAAARQPARGPWFPAITEPELGFLLPLVRFVDPRVAVAGRLAQTPAVADFFGQVHRGDAELAWHLWGHDAPPPLATLLQDQAAAARIVEFYLRHTTRFLHVLALRFEYAALFGLGVDDLAPDEVLVYAVEARWASSAGSAQSDPVPAGRRCRPPAPAWLHAARAPGTVPHPAFAAWPGWSPPAALAPQNASGAARPASSLVPQVPAAFTALMWAARAEEPNLLGYGPVLYQVARFDHGAASAGAAGAPALPANAVFVPLGDGELVARTDHEPHLLDRPGMPWPPLEGYYCYEVRGVDLLGTVSTDAVRAVLRHHDDLAPPAPRARAAVDRVIELGPGAIGTQVRLDVDWDPLEDFNGPDAREFRVSGSWIPTTAIPVHVEAVADAGPLHADLTVSSLPAPADGLAGARLTLPGSEFPIVSHTTGTPATMRVRKLAGRLPEAGGDGVVFAPGTPTPRTRVGRLARRAAAPATVSTVHGLAPLEISLAVAGGVPIPTDVGARLYLHLLRATVDAAFDAGTQRWRVSVPPADTPARSAWDRWTAVPDPAGAMAGSPVIVYPPHALTVDVATPPGFAAGLLVVGVTAADGAAYVVSPALPVADAALAGARGNESGAIDVVLSVRSAEPSPSPAVTVWDPNVRHWARSASVYAEDAEYPLAWSPAPGAVRYEVWRALEGALTGATSATNDAQLRAMAAQQASAFELRSDQVFTPAFTDRIPGRAPTRALYRVRAVGLNGIAGAPSEIIGPVYVPDVRQPPAPNLVRVVATPPEEADRAVAVEWTQPADNADLRFDVYVRPAGNGGETAFALAGSLPRGTAPGAGNAYRFLHGERPPGRPFEYEVVAVREALDPIDPGATVRRDIAGPPSVRKAGTAISSTPLAPPVSLAATFDATATTVTVTWTCRDFYDRIEVRRRAPGRRGFEVAAALAGDASTFAEGAPGSGIWTYQLRAYGASRQAVSDIDAEVDIP